MLPDVSNLFKNSVSFFPPNLFLQPLSIITYLKLYSCSTFVVNKRQYILMYSRVIRRKPLCASSFIEGN